MERNYNLSELSMMTGFSTRTLRNYLNSGLLEGEKQEGVWHFSAEALSRFFSEPFIREGLRIKRKAMVFDFLVDIKKVTDCACVVLDLPASAAESRSISAFFCERMKQLEHSEQTAPLNFNFLFDRGVCRVILSGDAAAATALAAEFCQRSRNGTAHKHSEDTSQSVSGVEDCMK